VTNTHRDSILTSQHPFMKDKPQPTEKRPEALKLNPGAICSECGVVGAFEFEGATLCLDCYTQKGSCCPEFSKDDLWRKRESS
jgi:hypothetical protein